jgi:Putative zinc-finger
MERAPLRPVPGPPTGPIPDAAAVTLVAAALPALDERDRTALALVGVAGTARPQVALRLGIAEGELAESLARARKELRRTLAPLPGSGWCERAERLISDRIDGPLEPRDEERLDVHLRNCPRCVEHERRLVQATDALIGGAAPAPVAPMLVPAAEPEQPELSANESAELTTLPAAGETDLAPRSPRALAGVISWNLLLVVAIVLALASLILVLAGALGAQL